MTNKKLTKSDNRVFYGVCAGLAEYFGFDITLMRAIYTILTIFTAFSGVLIYIVLAILMPNRDY